MKKEKNCIIKKTNNVASNMMIVAKKVVTVEWYKANRFNIKKIKKKIFNIILMIILDVNNLNAVRSRKNILLLFL